MQYNTLHPLSNSFEEQPTLMTLWKMDGLLKVTVEPTRIQTHDLILFKKPRQGGRLSKWLNLGQKKLFQVHSFSPLL